MTMLTDAAPAATPDAPTAAPDATPAPAEQNAPAAPTAGDAPAGEAKTPEQIAADEATAQAAADAEKAAAGAPEKYEDFKAPEGALLDAAVMTKFADAARALNLPQDKAQQLIDQMAPVIAARQAEQAQAFRTEWAAQSTADKEFGGAALTENLGHAKRALDQFASPELKGLLNETGLGNHPELVRFMVRAGKAISEDKIVLGGDGSKSKDRLNRFYDSPKKP